MTSIAMQSDRLPGTNIIAHAIAQVVGQAATPLALHEPYFSGKEKDYVTSCIEDGWVSSVGSFVDRFEKDLANTCGAGHAVAVVNGTAALHVALIASGLQPDEEVLIPSLTFVATANAVMHAGGVPHFVDVEERSLGICPDKLEAHLKQIATVRNRQTINSKTGRVIRALMPVHVFGHPCKLDKLAAIAQQYGLEFIEDATEALGAEYAGKKSRRSAHIGV